MRGKNELRLNLATVQEMAQYYFDNVLFKEGQVEIDGVSLITSESIMVIRTKEPEPQKMKAA